MKKLIPIFSIAFGIAACSSDPQSEMRTLQATQQDAAIIDTVGLAQFQQWKTQNELAAASPVQEAQQPVTPVKEVTIIREVRVPQPAPARRAVKKQPAPVQERPQPAVDQPVSVPTAGNGDVAGNSGSGSAGESESAGETAKEGGWSNAKKGAVIGGAGGAVVGAVIGKKNRAVGAVIGGVLGGAVGYGIGKKKDNKETSQ